MGAYVWNPLLSLLCPSLGTVIGAWTRRLLPFLSTSAQAMERISAMLLAGARVLEAVLVAAGGAVQCGWPAAEPTQGLAVLTGRPTSSFPK